MLRDATARNAKAQFQTNQRRIGSTYPYYVIRFLGGAFVLSGMLIMAYNVWKAIAGQRPEETHFANRQDALDRRPIKNSRVANPV